MPHMNNLDLHKIVLKIKPGRGRWLCTPRGHDRNWFTRQISGLQGRRETHEALSGDWKDNMDRMVTRRSTARLHKDMEYLKAKPEEDKRPSVQEEGWCKLRASPSLLRFLQVPGSIIGASSEGGVWQESCAIVRTLNRPRPLLSKVIIWISFQQLINKRQTPASCPQGDWWPAVFVMSSLRILLRKCAVTNCASCPLTRSQCRGRTQADLQTHRAHLWSGVDWFRTGSSEHCNEQSIFVRFQVLKAASAKTVVFWEHGATTQRYFFTTINFSRNMLNPWSVIETNFLKYEFNVVSENELMSSLHHLFHTFVSARCVTSTAFICFIRLSVQDVWRQQPSFVSYFCQCKMCDVNSLHFTFLDLFFAWERAYKRR
jgi:hypothetical protein